MTVKPLTLAEALQRGWRSKKAGMPPTTAISPAPGSSPSLDSRLWAPRGSRKPLVSGWLSRLLADGTLSREERRPHRRCPDECSLWQSCAALLLRFVAASSLVSKSPKFSPPAVDVVVLADDVAGAEPERASRLRVIRHIKCNQGCKAE